MKKSDLTIKQVEEFRASHPGISKKFMSESVGLSPSVVGKILAGKIQITEHVGDALKSFMRKYGWIDSSDVFPL